MIKIVLAAGLIDSFNPCAFGVLLAYLAILLSWKASRARIVSFMAVYIAAMFLAYFFIGLGILQAFHLFGVHNFFGWIAAVVIIGLGLWQLKEGLFPRLFVPVLSPLLSKCRVPKVNPNLTIIGAIVLGILVGLCEFPCSGGVYLATVSLISARETYLRGVGLLALYNLMFILPLAVVAALTLRPKVLETLKRLQASSSRVVRVITGLAMLSGGVGIIVWILLP